MKISEAIKTLEGDLNLCLSENHDYWGSIENYLEENNIFVKRDAMPEGPKSGKLEIVVVIG